MNAVEVQWSKTACPKGHAYTFTNSLFHRTIGYRCCRECDRERQRIKARQRTREQRQVERRRIAQRRGRMYDPTRYHAPGTRKPKAQKIKRLRWSKTAHCVAHLLCDDPTVPGGLLVSGIVYRAMYRYDPEFRVRELKRRHRRKIGRQIPDDGTLTGAVVQRLFAAARRCPYCRKKLNPRDKTLDHVEPKVRGGAHSILNVVVCCRSCNSRKQAAPPEQSVLRYFPALSRAGPEEPGTALAMLET